MKLKDLLFLLLIGVVGVFAFLSYEKLNEENNSSDININTEDVNFDERFTMSINGVSFPLILNENSSGYEFFTIQDVKAGDIVKFYYSDKVLNPTLEEEINVVLVDENYVIDSTCNFCQFYLKLNSDGSFNLWTSGYVEKPIENVYSYDDFVLRTYEGKYIVMADRTNGVRFVNDISEATIFNANPGFGLNYIAVKESTNNRWFGYSINEDTDFVEKVKAYDRKGEYFWLDFYSDIENKEILIGSFVSFDDSDMTYYRFDSSIPIYIGFIFRDVFHNLLCEHVDYFVPFEPGNIDTFYYIEYLRN